MSKKTTSKAKSSGNGSPPHGLRLKYIILKFSGKRNLIKICSLYLFTTHTFSKIVIPTDMKFDEKVGTRCKKIDAKYSFI